MSWDVVLFNSRQNIISAAEIDEAQLEPTDFCAGFESYFHNIQRNDNHREIKGTDFSIDYYLDDGPVSNKMVSLYGEPAIYELVAIARKFRWQIYDAGLDQMIDLENPAINGYENFQSYLRNVVDQNH